MPSTARRRWSREHGTQVDGITLGAEGPVLVHGYDAPAGGKWIDAVIPGKLAALDRSSGEVLWNAPCEVGYGRGFGAGFGPQGQCLVLGPSQNGHRAVRMALSDGELLESADIPAFDEALVAADRCICASAARVSAIDSLTLIEDWEYTREGERYHHIARSGDRVLVVFSNVNTRKCGVLALDAETGSFEGLIVAPSLPVVHGIVAADDAFVLLAAELEGILPSHRQGELASAIALHAGGGTRDTLSLVGLRIDGRSGDDPLWFQVLETRAVDELPEVSVSGDSGKLYLEQGAWLEARDMTTGRPLGQWTVPGLDEKIDWRVVTGAGLLAEETRVSIFELPA
ncbi:MAG: PQQ-binding-like beta-propeller repeat protein [Planctomycetota bacterium]|nr:PQQ-binding-like beta-propeller repeat protein [Planctomycetota bacterium]